MEKTHHLQLIDHFPNGKPLIFHMQNVNAVLHECHVDILAGQHPLLFNVFTHSISISRVLSDNHSSDISIYVLCCYYYIDWYDISTIYLQFKRRWFFHHSRCRLASDCCNVGMPSRNPSCGTLASQSWGSNLDLGPGASWIAEKLR